MRRVRLLLTKSLPRPEDVVMKEADELEEDELEEDELEEDELEEDELEEDEFVAVSSYFILFFIFSLSSLAL
jgi:hypothetical protein